MAKKKCQIWQLNAPYVYYILEESVTDLARSQNQENREYIEHCL